MKLASSHRAWLDYVYWQQNDWSCVEKINVLIKECMRTPFAGVGKPEPLRGELRGFWSRRISGEHRLVYRVRGSADEQVLEIAYCRFHYIRPEK
ncbi:Txe/YoeB family addiction module toxin [Rhizobium sp. RAF56]|uniref:Txe/YoeB family addiction module toxin n=1 Tax=Rhizobium sp. RAF56 TaxID=3233062 RepID=UPI003F9C5A2D